MSPAPPPHFLNHLEIKNKTVLIPKFNDEKILRHYNDYVRHC